MSTHRKKISRHVHKKIIFRVRIFFVLSIIFAGILSWDLITGQISLVILLISLLVGVGGGIVASRSSHLTWDHDGKQIVGKMDKIGVVVLILYICFAFFRNQIVGVFVHGPLLGTVTIALMGGLFIGQIIGIRHGIYGILKDEEIIK